MRLQCVTISMNPLSNQTVDSGVFEYLVIPVIAQNSPEILPKFDGLFADEIFFRPQNARPRLKTFPRHFACIYHQINAQPPLHIFPLGCRIPLPHPPPLGPSSSSCRPPPPHNLDTCKLYSSKLY